MWQTLFVIPYEIHGVPLFGFGVLLWVWLAGSIFLFARLLYHHGFDAETRGPLLPVFLVGAAIYLVPRLFPGGLPIRGYGVMVLLGVVAGVALATFRARQMGLDGDLIVSLAFWMIVPGVVGARLFHVLEYWHADYARDSILETIKAVINVPQGGLVMYGSLVGGVAGFVAFARHERLPGLALADLIAPSLALGLALGRIGCFLNGCCYGGPCHLPWAVTFPPGSPPYETQLARGQVFGIDLGANSDGTPRIGHVAPGSVAAQQGLRAGQRVVRVNGRQVTTTGQVQRRMLEACNGGRPLRLETATGLRVELRMSRPPPRSLPVHPTQLYSSVAALLLSFFLWVYYPFRHRDGQVAALLLSIYPVQRFLLEMIRTDEPGIFPTGLTVSQNGSLLLLVGSAFFWWYLVRRPRELALPLAAGSRSDGVCDRRKRSPAGHPVR